MRWSLSPTVPIIAEHSVMNNQTDHIIFIAGASRGIGRALALELATPNTHIIALARSVAELESLDDTITETTGQSITLLPADLTEADKIASLGPQLAERFGRIDQFYYTAGVMGQLSPLQDINPKQWSELMNLNLNVPFQILRTIHPLLLQSAQPAVALLSADQNQIGAAYFSAFGASKAALKALAQSYAAENPGFNVYAECPGLTATSHIRDAYPGKKNDLLTPEEAARKIITAIEKGITNRPQKQKAQ